MVVLLHWNSIIEQLQQIQYNPQNSKYLLSGLLQKKFAELWSILLGIIIFKDFSISYFNCFN